MLAGVQQPNISKTAISTEATSGSGGNSSPGRAELQLCGAKPLPRRASREGNRARGARTPEQTHRGRPGKGVCTAARAISGL